MEALGDVRFIISAVLNKHCFSILFPKKDRKLL